MKLRQIIIVTVILVGTVLLAAGLAMNEQEEEKEVKVAAKKYVKTQKVAYKAVPTEIVAFGRVETAQALDLIAEKAGRMAEGDVPLKEGKAFNKGQLLFAIDATEAQLNLQAEKSRFLSDLAAILADLKSDFPESYPTWQQYFEQIDIARPLPELPTFRTAKEKTFLATKNIFSSYYTIKSQEEGMKKYRQYAPFAGSITEVSLHSGSYVNPGSKVASVKRRDRLELRVAISANDIAWVKAGNKLSIENEQGTAQWQGTINRIGSVVNKNTQALDVFIAIAPNEHPVYDGLFLKAIIPGKTVQGAMEIPRAALVNGQQVYVVQDTVLSVRTVAVRRLNDQTAIISGLEQGEDLVTETLVNAANNMRVYKLPDEGQGKGTVDEQLTTNN